MRTPAEIQFIRLDDRSDAGRQPLEIDQLVTIDQRRGAVERHQAFRESISAPAHDFDTIDELVEELRAENFEGRYGR